ncbi:MAG: anhydro-N-acetylmuramic acid kinase [Rickettsiales bacterium]
MAKIFKAIGLMSGTSLDGIDLALIETDGFDYIKVLKTDYFAFEDNLQIQIKKIFFEKILVNEICELENIITNHHIELVNNFLKKNNLKSQDIDLIGFHGLTLYHNPSLNISWQIGNSQNLATKTNIKVIGNFRSKDISRGGQGAPLVPIYHYHLFRNKFQNLMVLNIGGVANYSYFEDNIESLFASDLSFGNAVFNDKMQKYFNKNFDDEGKLASTGKVNEGLINEIMQHKIFQIKPPISFSRNDFDEVLAPLNQLEVNDILANYCQIFSLNLRHKIEQNFQPKKIIICGGGAYNLTLVNYIKNSLPNIEILTAKEAGFSIDSIEAEAFAFLAVRSSLNLPISFKKTTDCKDVDGCVGGVIFNP